MTNSAELQTITSQGISAQMEIRPDGIAFHAPISYMGIEIRKDGCWAYGVSHTDAALVEEALHDCFIGLRGSMDAFRRAHQAI